MLGYFWDIETSTIKCDNGQKVQVTYLSNVLSMDMNTGEIINSKFFRTIEETVAYFLQLPKITVWVHNLDYELTFLLRELGECKGLITEEGKEDILFRTKHSPLQITLDLIPNVTFRDSYAIFNKGVKMLGEELNLPKLPYEYKKVRLPWDNLKEIDYKYNERDNVIVAKSLYNYMILHNIAYEDIPLTFTSAVKRDRKAFINENFGKKELTSFYIEKASQIEDFDFFEMQLKVYQGGLTTSNMLLTNKLIEKDVHSIDIKSSYPNQMCTKRFPLYRKGYTSYLEGKSANTYFKKGKYKGFMGLFEIDNIRVKNEKYLLPISKAHIEKTSSTRGCKFYNGKLIEGKRIQILLNDVDLEILNLCYDYDSILCFKGYFTNYSRYLHYSEISFLLNCFKTKEETPKGTFEYDLSKVRINAQYGIKVTKPIKSIFSIIEGELEEKTYLDLGEEERKEKYYEMLENKFSGAFDIFTDGIYITSFARLQLVKMMIDLINLNANVIYSDTDSIKFYSDDITPVINHIEKFNKEKVNSNMRNKNFREFKKQFEVTEEVFEKICNLGIWEIETENKNGELTPYKAFKTLGAKKYCYIDNDNNIHSTIAGCNKHNVPVLIERYAKLNNKSLVKAMDLIFRIGITFDDTVYIEEGKEVWASGRTVAYREKTPRNDMDFLTYNGRMIHQYGGIIIENTTYTLGISESDKQIIPTGLTNICSINMKGVLTYE